jgi:hypothetical protein
MAAKKPPTKNLECTEALHALVMELNFTQRKRLKDKISMLQSAFGDATDPLSLGPQVAVHRANDGRGKHWAERRALQNYLLVDAHGGKKQLTQLELENLTKKNHKQLQVAFFKGKGELYVSVRDPRGYGLVSATITKL